MLNIACSGLGYIYVGKRKIFGILLVIAVFVCDLWLMTSKSNYRIIFEPVVWLGSILFVIAISYDVYQDALEYNRNLTPKA